jgi:hypothetical protein
VVIGMIRVKGGEKKKKVKIEKKNWWVKVRVKIANWSELE